MVTIFSKIIKWLVFLAFIVSISSAHGALHNKLLLSVDGSSKEVVSQNTALIENTALREKIEDDFGRGSPRSSIENFLNVVRQSDYQKGVNYLDFSMVDQKIRKIPKEEVVRLFKLVLDRSLWIDLPALSDDAQGFINDGVVENRDVVGYIPLKDQEIPVYVQRVSREDGVPIWKVAGISVNYLPELYVEYGDGPVGEALDGWVPDVSILGLLVWQWIAMILIFVVAFLMAWLPTKLIAQQIIQRDYAMSKQVAAIVSGPIRMLIFVLLARAACPLMGLSLEARQMTQGYTLLIIAFTWALLSVISILRDFFVERLNNDERKSVAKLLHPLTTMLKIILVITASLVWLENLGFQASTIIAGLGIGGLAFALAAQKSIENLIAAITLYVSSPVKVGNLCQIGKHLGFIEEIGLRYTKVRTLDRTLVSISNSIFADLQLENYSERNRIRYKPELVLSYKTSKKKIKKVIVAIQTLLNEHESICDVPCRVRLANYLEYGVSISVMSYVDTTRFAVYAEVSNELNLAILDILDDHNVKLADLSRGGLAKSPQESVDSL